MQQESSHNDQWNYSKHIGRAWKGLQLEQLPQKNEGVSSEVNNEQSSSWVRSYSKVKTKPVSSLQQIHNE